MYLTFVGKWIQKRKMKMVENKIIVRKKKKRKKEKQIN